MPLQPRRLVADVSTRRSPAPLAEDPPLQWSPTRSSEISRRVLVDLRHDAQDIMKSTNMRTRILLALALALVISAQPPPGHTRPGEEPAEDARLPNGKLQRDEILKAEFQKSLDDARELSKLADELRTDLEKNDRYVLSIATLKKTEDIEKLAKRIHDRLKH